MNGLPGAAGSRQRQLACAFLAVTLAWAGRASAEQIYSIQVGAYATAAEAESARVDFATTCPQAFIREASDATAYPFKLAVGRFACYAHAWVINTKLDHSSAGYFITSVEAEEDEFVQSPPPVTYPFDTQGLEAAEPADAAEFWSAAGFDPAGPASTVDTRASPVICEMTQDADVAEEPDMACATGEELLGAGMKAPGNPDATVYLEFFLATKPSDTRSNHARLCLARVLGRGANFERAESLLASVRATGIQPEKVMADFLDAHLKHNRRMPAQAFEAFRSLANNKNVPPSLRREAMLRAANIAHALQNYPDAWLAFEQVEQTALDAATAAEARMQRAGLAFELVGRGKGTWEEVRTLCRAVEEIDDAPRKTLATAGLMHLETFFEEGRMSEALAQIHAFAVNYQDIPREYYTARVWEGIVLQRLGRTREAQFILEAVMNTPLPASEKFAGMDPQARAAVWVTAIAQGRGDLQARDRAVDLLQRSHPDSEETKRALVLRGTR